MEKNIFAIRIILTFLASLLFVPQHAVAQEMEWTIKTERNLEATPLDTAVSADGRLIFILSPGEILVYSVLQQKVINRIPVDKRFDRVTFSRADNTLIVTSSSEKVLKTIQLEFIQNIDITGLPFKGPANAPVTVAVFNDYQWPYCLRLEPVLQQVLEKYPKEVKLVIKHFPLAKHKFAQKAATAALAAHRQGKFWEFHERIFQNFKALNDAKFQEIARELALDLKKFNEDIQDPAIRNQINFDLRNGRRAGVRGTPTVFVNGKRLQQRKIQGFTRIIEAELSKKW